MSAHPCIGVDDGHAEIKIAMPDGSTFSMPSQAVAGALNKVAISGGEASTFGYETDDGHFMVGAIDRSDPTDFDDYPVSALNRVLVVHALRQAGLGGKALRICSGIPVKRFYRGSRMDEELIKAKQANLLRNDVKTEGKGAIPAIISHDVVSEAISAWLNHVVSRGNDGKLSINKDLASAHIAIVDIGGRTTDVAVVRNWELDMGRSSTINAGVLAVREALRESVRDQYGVEINDGQVQQALRTGQLPLWGEHEDVSPLVSEALESTTNHIRAEVCRRLGKAADLDRVIFVGGGVGAFGDRVQGWFRNQSVADNPSFANAMGMQKYSELMAKG